MTAETTEMLRPVLTDDEIETINRTRALLFEAADRASVRVLVAARRAEEGEAVKVGLEQNHATIVEEYAKIASDALTTFLIRAKVYGGVPVTDEQLSHAAVQAKYGSRVEDDDDEPAGNAFDGWERWCFESWQRAFMAWSSRPDPDVEPDYDAGPEPDGMTEHDWRL